MRRRRPSNVSLTGGIINIGRPLSAEPSPPHYSDDALLVSTKAQTCGTQFFRNVKVTFFVLFFIVQSPVSPSMEVSPPIFLHRNTSLGSLLLIAYSEQAAKFNYTVQFILPSVSLFIM